MIKANSDCIDLDDCIKNGIETKKSNQNQKHEKKRRGEVSIWEGRDCEDLWGAVQS